MSRNRAPDGPALASVILRLVFSGESLSREIAIENSLASGIKFITRNGQTSRVDGLRQDKSAWIGSDMARNYGA